MYPELFHLSFLHTYGVLVALAFLVGLWMAGRLARSSGLSEDAVTNLGISCGLAAIIGAKLRSSRFPPCGLAGCFTAG